MSLTIFSEILIYMILAGLLLWAIKYTSLLYLISRKQEEINKLQARISILKLHLKGKIKRKCNKIQDYFKKEPDSNTFRLLESKLNTIATLTFSAPGDYQILIHKLSSITQDITEYIDLKQKKAGNKPESPPGATAPGPSANPPSEKDKIIKNCKDLVKYDKGHMLVIIEIIDSTEKLIEKINECNLFIHYKKNQKKITDIPDKIVIEHYELLAELVEPIKNQKPRASGLKNSEKNSEQNSDADVFKETA